MIYDVWFRKTIDGRAPEIVNLETEYMKSCTIEAFGPREVERSLILLPETKGLMIGANKQMRVGDVIVEKATPSSKPKRALIYTPQGAWASVKVTLE